MNRREFLQSSALLLVRPQGAARIGTIAGTGMAGLAADGGPADREPINNPFGIVIGLRQGTVTTVAGTGQRGDGPGGDPLACKLARPHGVFIQGRNVYIGDSENHRIRLLQV